jgi:hypothetical protein
MSAPPPAKPNRAWCSPRTSGCSPGLQRGMHQPGFTHLALSGEERRVINMHRNLECYLDLPEAERMRDAMADRAVPN